jgi:thiol-disulfide isomerase/thioredoxin
MNALATRLQAPLLALAVLALAPSGAVAAAADRTMRFEPIGVYLLEVDGKIVEGAKMYHSSEAAAVLVMAPQLPYPIAVVPRNKTVQKLDPAELAAEARGALAWTPSGQQTAIATFDLVEEKPVFQLQGKKVRFLDKPPLLGTRSIDEIVAYDPSYGYRKETAQVSTVYLDVLEKWPQDVVVKIFFSTQCQVCRELLPNILSTVEKLEDSKIDFEFYGMPLPASGDPLAKELQISDFPTGIVYQDGKEMGRATGHSWRMPAMAIHNALLGIAVDPEALRVDPGAVKPRS